MDKPTSPPDTLARSILFQPHWPLATREPLQMLLPLSDLPSHSPNMQPSSKSPRGSLGAKTVSDVISPLYCLAPPGCSSLHGKSHLAFPPCPRTLGSLNQPSRSGVSIYSSRLLVPPVPPGGGCLLQVCMRALEDSSGVAPPLPPRFGPGVFVVCRSTTLAGPQASRDCLVCTSQPIIGTL